MNTPISAPENSLQKEQRLFREQSARLVNALLNRMFDLKPSSAIRRAGRLFFLLLLAGFIIGLRPYPLTEWGDHIQELFISFFTQKEQLNQLNPSDALSNLFILGLKTFTNPYTLWYLPAFLLPFFIAQQAASFYLADIFELQDVGIARKFINQVALTGSNDVIRITAGDIAQEDRDSPIYQIGGPGKIIVDLDSVVLFEKADGQPNVIGPTGKEPGGKATLDGFERFRQALDLRDHYIDLRDQDDKSPSVKSRSLDGIPITATDVRLMYSVYRGDKPEPTPELPYPFLKKSIEQLIYKSFSKVTPEQQFPSQYQFLGLGPIVNMVRNELMGFMSQKKLTEYLASIGESEFNKAKEQEKAIVKDVRAVLPRNDPAPSAKPVKPPPPFTPRYKISDLFGQFAKKFTDGVRDRGIELHWIGVGTWKVPEEIIPATKVVPEHHLEAWKISRENLIKTEDEKVKISRREAELQKLTAMIQGIPLAAYSNITAGSPAPDHDEAVKSLLQEYQRQITDNHETLRKKDVKQIPPSLTAAIFHIYKTITPSHSVYPPPPPPATARERELYDELMNKIRSHEVIEQLIALKRESKPNAGREEWLETINKDWDDDLAGKWKPGS